MPLTQNLFSALPVSLPLAKLCILGAHVLLSLWHVQTNGRRKENDKTEVEAERMVMRIKS